MARAQGGAEQERFPGQTSSGAAVTPHMRFPISLFGSLGRLWWRLNRARPQRLLPYAKRSRQDVKSASWFGRRALSTNRSMKNNAAPWRCSSPASSPRRSTATSGGPDGRRWGRVDRSPTGAGHQGPGKLESARALTQRGVAGRHRVTSSRAPARQTTCTFPGTSRYLASGCSSSVRSARGPRRRSRPRVPGRSPMDL
jgi:hypothetical protein